MAVVIGQASIKITALAEGLKRDIGRELNDALGDIKIDANPLKDLNADLGRTADSSDRARGSLGRFTAGTGDADRETSKLHKTMQGLHGVTRGIGAVFGFLLPSMHQVGMAGQALGAVLSGLTKVTAVALAGQAAFAGAGGLVAVAGALSQAAGAALLLPAALGAGVIAIGALTIGFQGMGDALKNVGDPAKFAEAIKELSPNARAFAIAVRDMVPAFKELRTQVQDRLFAGLAQDFSEIGKIHLPVVQKGLTAMAASLNEGAKGFSAFARDKQTVSDLGTLFANSSLGAHFLAQAVQPVLSALRDIGTVGSEFLPGLADGFGAAAQRFGEFIAHARETGKLKEIMSEGLSALGDIFSILGNIGSIIGSVLHAGQAAGAGFLATAKEVTGQLAAWAKSGAGQSALTEFLTSAKQVAMALLPILGSVIELIAHQLAPILANLATTVGPSVKIALDAIGQGLEVARPGIAALGQGFANFIAALAPALPAIGTLVSVLGVGLGTVLNALGPVIAQVAMVFAEQLATAIPLVVPAVISIAQALGNLLSALAPVIPALVQILGPFTEAGGIIEALVPIIEVLVEAIGEIVTALSPLISMVADVLIQVLDAAKPVIASLADALVQLMPAFVSLVEAVLPLVPPLAQLISAILPPLIDLFTVIAVPIIELAATILNILVPPIAWLLTLVAGVVTGVINFFTNLGTNVSAILSALADFFTGIWNGMKNIAISAVTGLVSGISSTLSAVGAFFSNAFGAAKDAVVNAFNRIKDAVSSGIENVLSFLRGLPGKILGAIGDLGRLLYDAGAKIITGLLDGLKHAAQAVWDFVSGIGSKIANLKGPLDVDKRLLIPAGLAIMGGLHASLIAGFGPVAEFMTLVGPRLAGAFQAPDLSTGVSTPQLPGIRLGAGARPAGGDGASSPADLHEAVVAAIEGWQVIVSARETASKVNKINQDNRGR